MTTPTTSQTDVNRTNPAKQGEISPDNEPYSSIGRTKALVGLYSIWMIFWAYLDTSGSVLSAPLISQLDATYVEYAGIYMHFGIGSLMSAIISSFVVDQYQSSHHYIAFLVVSASIATCLIPSCDTEASQSILWVALGASMGAFGVAMPVYIFRAWPGKASSYFFGFLCISGVHKAAMPLLIEVSILHFGSYEYALFLMTSIGFVCGLFALILPTPKHDELRSVRAILRRESSVRSADEVFKELQQKPHLRNVLVGLFGTLLLLFREIPNISALESGMIIFIASYTEQYLNQKYVGRYLISTYSVGQLLFRVIRAASSLRDQSEMTAFRALWFGHLAGFALLVVWIVTTVDYQFFVLFAVFGGSGFVLAGTYPLVHELCETVTPIKGRICCIFSICCSIGDISMTYLLAAVVEKYGIQSLPYSLVFVSGVQMAMVLVTRSMFRHYKLFQFAVVSSKMQMHVTKHNTNPV